MGKVGKIIVGVALVGLSIYNPTLLGFKLTSLGVSVFRVAGMALVNGAIRRKPLGQTAGETRRMQTGTDMFVPVVYGEAELAIRPIFIARNPNNQKELILGGVICMGSQDGTGIEGVTSVSFDETEALEPSPTFVDDGTFPLTADVTSKYSGYLRYGLHLGTDAQTHDTGIAGIYPSEWTSAHRLRSMAVIFVGMTLDEEEGKFVEGVPNIVIKARGQKCYDPRDTNTVWTQNPALMIRDLLTAPEERYGAGIAAADIDDTSISAAANICDSDPGNGRGAPMFTANGVINPADGVENNLAKLLSACRGMLVYEAGKYRLHINQADAVSGIKLGEADIHGEVKVSLPGMESRPNEMVVSFIEPENKWQVDQVAIPDPSGSNTFLTADNNVPNPMEIGLAMTTSRQEAQDIGFVTLKEMRVGIPVSFTASEAALEAVVGDIIELTVTDLGWTDKQVRVLGLEQLPNGLINVVGMLHDATVYDLDTSVAIPTVPGTTLPDPSTCLPPTTLLLDSSDLTAVITGDGTVLPRVSVEWTQSLDPFLRDEEVSYRTDPADPWEPFARIRASDVAAGQIGPVFTPPVVEGDTVYIRVVARNTLGVKSTELTGSDTASGKAVAPANVTGFSVSLHPLGLFRASWDANSEVDLSHYELRYGGTGWSDATVLGARLDTTRWTGLASDLGAAARSTTFRIKAFDRSGLESATAATVAFSDPAPTGVAGTAVARNGLITVTVNTTTTNARRMDLYASTTASFTPGDSNRVATQSIPEDGQAQQKIIFPIEAGWDGQTVYMRLGYTDFLTIALAESEVLSTEFNTTGADPGDTDNAGGGLVFNGDMEHPTNLAYWEDTHGQASIETGSPIAGSKSLVLTSQNGSTTQLKQAANITASETRHLPVRPGQRYRLQATGFVESSGLDARVLLTWFNDSKSFTGSQGLLFSAETSTATLSSIITVPAGTAYMRVEVWILSDASAPRDFTVDDILLEVAEEGSPGAVDLMFLNGDLEHDTDGAYLAVNAAFNGTADIETASPLSGSKSGRIVSSTSQDAEVYASTSVEGFVEATDSNRRWIPVRPGDNFRCQGTFKGQSDHAISFKVLEVDSDYGSDAWATVASFSSTSSLTFLEVYTVPAGVAYICFAVVVEADSSARNYYYDDIMVRRYFTNTAGIPVIGMAEGGQYFLGDTTLPTLNSSGGAAGTDDGKVYWGSEDWQFITPSGVEFTIPADSVTYVSDTTPEETDVTLAFVGGNTARFTGLADPLYRRIVAVRNTATYGWEYLADAGWLPFTPDELNDTKFAIATVHKS